MSLGHASGPRVERICHGEFEVKGVAEQSPVFASRAEGERWLKDYLRGLPPHRQPRVRACLCCGGSFNSEGAHHRMCGSCRSASGTDTGVFGFALAGRGGRKAAGR